MIPQKDQKHFLYSRRNKMSMQIQSKHNSGSRMKGVSSQAPCDSPGRLMEIPGEEG